jgi:hypothetical protein
LKLLFGLLADRAIRKKLEVVVKVIDRLLEGFDRGGEAAGVEPIAFLVVACGEVVEGEVDMTTLIHLMIYHALEEELAQEEYESIDLRFL